MAESKTGYGNLLLQVVVVVVGGGVGGGGGGVLRLLTFSGKLSLALLPLNLRAAASYALAAPSAVSNVPSQTRHAFCGSRISAAHFPHGLCLTPLYFLCRLAAAAALGAG